MKNVFLVLVLFSCGTITNTLFAQNTQRVKEVLDDYCDKYFEDCFGWTYIKIVSIDEVTIINDEKVRVEGIVRNTGYFGSVHNRDFVATISEIDYYRARIKFSKHGNIGGSDFWTDCVKVIKKD